MTCQCVTEAERTLICRWNQESLENREIASRLDRAPSNIGHEFARNTGLLGGGATHCSQCSQYSQSNCPDNPNVGMGSCSPFCRGQPSEPYRGPGRPRRPGGFRQLPIRIRFFFWRGHPHRLLCLSGRLGSLYLRPPPFWANETAIAFPLVPCTLGYLSRYLPEMDFPMTAQRRQT
jgi:hypothetical protein